MSAVQLRGQATRSSSVVPRRQAAPCAVRGGFSRPQHRRQERQRQLAECRAAATEQTSEGPPPPQQQPVATARRVVLAVDASEDSIAAFNWVLANLMRTQDELHLLHVVPDIFVSPASGSIYYCSSPDHEVERALWQQAKAFFVENFVERAKEAGLGDSVWLHLVKESRTRHIGKAVCKKAEELGAEPLVVAAHDKPPLEQLLLGSVSKFCVANCKRPVLLLHPNHTQL